MWFPLLFVGAGALCIVQGLLALLRVRRFLAIAEKGVGVVSGHNAVRLEEGTAYQPIVRFTAPDGREVTFVERFGRARERWPVGSTVPIKFDPNRYENARIDGGLNYYGGPFIAWLVGSVFLAVGLLLMFGHPGGSSRGGE